jgi:hypothetical protein
MVIVLSDYMFVNVRVAFALFKFVSLQIIDFWSVHKLSLILLFGLWLSYYALVFVCLMQSLSYMILMNIPSLTLSLKSENIYYKLKKAYTHTHTHTHTHTRARTYIYI